MKMVTYRNRLSSRARKNLEFPRASSRKCSPLVSNNIPRKRIVENYTQLMLGVFREIWFSMISFDFKRNMRVHWLMQIIWGKCVAITHDKLYFCHLKANGNTMWPELILSNASIGTIDCNWCIIFTCYMWSRVAVVVMKSPNIFKIDTFAIKLRVFRFYE